MKKPSKSTIPAGSFKTHCLRIMDEIYRKRFSLTVTRHGKPIVKLVPIDQNSKQINPATKFFGCLEGTTNYDEKTLIRGVNEKWDANE